MDEQPAKMEPVLFYEPMRDWVPNWEKIVSLVTLSSLLDQIKATDTDYDVRNPLVIQALAVASTLKYPCGFRINPSEPNWLVIQIELPTGQVSWYFPTGQVSWHTPQYQATRDGQVSWDGHSVDERFNRIDAFKTMVTQAVEDPAVLESM